MNLQDIAVLEGKVRHRGEGAVAHDDHVTARELEETLDISDIFAAAIALPRQTAAEAELAAEADGDDGADIRGFHEILPPALLASQKHHSRAYISPCRCVRIAGLSALWQYVIHGFAGLVLMGDIRPGGAAYHYA